MGQSCQPEGAVSVKHRVPEKCLAVWGETVYGTDVVGGFIRSQMEKGLE